jgi:hypothetical protein
MPLPGASTGWYIIRGMSAVSSSDIWAVVESTDQGDQVLHWNGSTWTLATVPGLVGSLFSVAAMSSSDVWIGGFIDGAPHHMFLAHWDGSTWVTETNLPNSGQGMVLGLAKVGPNDFWAVGSFTDQTTSREHILTMRWNGSQWVQVPAPYPNADSALWSVSASSANEAWAVGSYSSLPIIEHWDGTQWSIVADPGLGTYSYLNFVVSFSPTDAWAAGFVSNQGTNLPLAIHWDGSAWSISDIPQVPLITYYHQPPLGFSASGPNDLWFASTSAGPPYSPVILHRTSSGWQRIPVDLLPMDLGAPLNVLALSPQNVWVLGVLPGSSGDSMIAFHYASTCGGVKPGK